MLFISYIIIYVLTVVLAIEPRVIPKRLFFVTWFIVMSFYSFSLRWTALELNIPENDFIAYVSNMMITDYILPYHWKEPIFWLGTRYLYQLFESAYVVYIITDLILFLAFYHSLSKIRWIIPQCKNFANPKYLYFSAFLFFPFVLSMANAYRTILALPFFLLALGYGRREVMKCIISFIIAVLIHNGYFLFVPVLLFLFKGQVRYFIPIIMATLAILLVVYIDLDFIYAMTSRQLNSNIGRNIHFYILLTLMFIISVTLFS